MEVFGTNAPFLVAQLLNFLLLTMVLTGLPISLYTLLKLRRRHLPEGAWLGWAAFILLVPWLGAAAFWFRRPGSAPPPTDR